MESRVKTIIKVMPCEIETNLKKLRKCNNNNKKVSQSLLCSCEGGIEVKRQPSVEGDTGSLG